MLIADAVTVTVGKGDILGAILLLVVIVPALWLALGAWFDLLVNGLRSALRTAPLIVIGWAALSGVGWVLWWVAHWFTSTS